MDELEILALAAAAAKNKGGVSTNSGAVGEFKDKVRALATGGADALAFGFGDNIAAGIGGAVSMARGDGFNRGYDETLDIVREGMGRDQSENPLQYGAGTITGATAQAALTGPLATGKGLLGTVGRGGVLGAVEGGMQGAGHADGQDVMENAWQGAKIGGMVGLGAPLVVSGGAAVKNAVKDPATGVIDALTGRANVGKANRAIANTVRSDGQSQADISSRIGAALREGQPDYRLMDALGVAGQRRASGIARSGGDAGTEISEFLRSRQAGQSERVGSFVDDAFGTRGTTAAQTKDRLTSSRNAAADTAYTAARGNAAPVDVRGALGVIDSRIGGMRGSNVAGDSIDGKLAGYRQRLAADPAPNGEIARELSDFDRVLGVKQSIQDDIGAAVRAGRNNEARELGKVVQELDAALEQSSDMYRAANDGFRDASRVVDSVDEGAAMSQPRNRAADTTAQFSNMNPEQQGAARIGYGDDLQRRIEANTSPTANKAKILQSPKRDAEARAISLDPDQYGNRLSRENEMWETQNRALGGSRTSDNLEDISQSGDAASGVMGAARSGANFQFGDAVAKVGALIGPVAKGQTDATRQLIARALMSDDPVKALAPAMRQQRTSDATRRIVEALIRQTANETGRALRE